MSVTTSGYWSSVSRARRGAAGKASVAWWATPQTQRVRASRCIPAAGRAPSDLGWGSASPKDFVILFGVNAHLGAPGSFFGRWAPGPGGARWVFSQAPNARTFSPKAPGRSFTTPNMIIKSLGVVDPQTSAAASRSRCLRIHFGARRLLRFAGRAAANFSQPPSLPPLYDLLSLQNANQRRASRGAAGKASVAWLRAPLSQAKHADVTGLRVSKFGDRYRRNLDNGSSNARLPSWSCHYTSCCTARTPGVRTNAQRDPCLEQLVICKLLE